MMLLIIVNTEDNDVHDADKCVYMNNVDWVGLLFRKSVCLLYHDVEGTWRIVMLMMMIELSIHR